MKRMINYLNYLVVLTLTMLSVVSCLDNNVEPIFDKSINERTAKLTAEYTKILTSSQHGWVGFYSPNGKLGSNTLLLKFNNDSVIMRTDYLVRSAIDKVTDDTITYRIDKTLKMELVFESHATLHRIFEINRNNNEGEFIFNITTASDNEVVLTSKTDSGYGGKEVTKVTLKKAKAPDWDLSGIAPSLKKINATSSSADKYFRNLLIDDKVVASFTYDEYKRTATISYLEDGKQTDLLGRFNILPAGFSLYKPLEINGVTFSDFTYDPGMEGFIDTQKRVKIIYQTRPPFSEHKLIIDPKIVQQMRYFHLDKDLPPGLTTPGFEALYEGANATDFVFFNDSPVGENKIDYFYIDTKSGEVRALYTYEDRGDRIVFMRNGYRDKDSVPTTAGQRALLDFLFDSEGFYVNNLGEITTYTIDIYTFTSVKNPSIRIAFYKMR